MFDPDLPPEEWIQDPHTLRLLRHYQDQRKDAHESLMDACSRSTDPEVRGLYERFSAMRMFSLHLNGGKIGSRNDGT